jgi:transcriptional regulator with XRE-family HTH domain
MVDHGPGHEVKRLRLLAGLSPTELARISGISRATIYAIEAGKSRKPEPATLQDLGNALDGALSGRANTVAETGHCFRLLMEAAGYPVPPELGVVLANAGGLVLVNRLGPYRIVPMAIRAAAGPRGWTLNGGAMRIDSDLVSGRDLIAITVSGDCMAPELNHGHVAIVDVGGKNHVEGRSSSSRPRRRTAWLSGTRSAPMARCSAITPAGSTAERNPD